MRAWGPSWMLWKRLANRKNTYIIYTSDNGGGLGPNGTLRGGKANLYEGGLRVPLWWQDPECNRACNAMYLLYNGTCFQRFMITARASNHCHDLDGGSLRQVFENGNVGKVVRPVEGFVFHYPCYFAPPLSVIRLGDYKLMEHHLTGSEGSTTL